MFLGKMLAQMNQGIALVVHWRLEISTMMDLMIWQ